MLLLFIFSLYKISLLFNELFSLSDLSPKDINFLSFFLFLLFGLLIFILINFVLLFLLLFISLSILILLKFFSSLFSLRIEQIEKFSLKKFILLLSFDSLSINIGLSFFSVENLLSSKLGKSKSKELFLLTVSLSCKVWLNFGVEDIYLFSTLKIFKL